MIRQRAKLSAAVSRPARWALPNSRADVRAGALGKPARPPARVGRLEQLVELAISQVLLAATLAAPDIVHHPHLEVGTVISGSPRARRRALCAAEHLLEVLGIERLASLRDLAGDPQPELLQPGSRVVLAEQPDPQDQRGQPAQQHDRKRVHRRAVYPRIPIAPNR